MTTSTPQLSLGLDSSTQSLTAVVVDLGQGRVVHELSLDYGRDERLAGLGLHARDYLVPPRVPGEADQPPELYLASLDALFADLQKRGVALENVAVINVSGQQHGHLYLSAAAAAKFAQLRDPASAGSSLPALLAGSLAYQTAPIWRTSNTAAQAEQIRAGVGGKARMIELSGSDSPLRFTGAVMRRVGQQFPEAYAATEIVQLISSYIPAVLCGDAKVPTDFGNGSGMSLMDYQARAWSDALVAAAGAGLPGGAAAFRAKLPALTEPDACVGTIAAYFVKKYGFSPACRIAAGSGDNPQTKVLVAGDLLSLGTSFVFMVSTDGKSVDREGYANAMYDGVGRPFAFGCRTNGAMVWDRVRALHGLAKKDYGPAEKALAAGTPGEALFLWQPENESFPASPGFAERRVGYDKPSLQADYGGIIDSTLAAVYVYSRHFSRESAEPLHVTGGATDSPQIMRRVAAIWNRPVAAIGKVGAALGTAVAGASALQRALGQKPAVESLAAALLPSAAPVVPSPADVARYHGKGGYLERFRDAYPRAWAK
jgi:xylulokinase